jgi:exonuclease SbcC
VKLHRIEVTAFGPFAGTVEVDFDAVGVNGLFLVHGPTGAGKTSLLDAICFALYAGVPGARPGGKALRSDHSGRHAVPLVRLEFGVGRRRFRITRSPEFQRPKKRGTGETSSPARVVLEEHTGGRWTARSSRADEVGEIVTEVLGMGLAQFSKVVLLPQGEFAAFLRATADERRTLLEKLFDISTYAGVETWLSERRRQLGADLADARAGLAADLARLETVLAQVPAEVLGDSAAPTPSSTPEDPGPGWESLRPDFLPDRIAEIAAVLDAHAVGCLVAASEAEGRAASAQAVATQAASTAERQRRGSAARRELQVFDADAQRWGQLQRSVERAGRADAVAGDLRALARALGRRSATEQRRDRAAQAVTRCGVAWAVPLPDPESALGSPEPALSAPSATSAPSVASVASTQEWVRTLEERGAQLDGVAGRVRGLDADRERLAGLTSGLAAQQIRLGRAHERVVVAERSLEQATADAVAQQATVAQLARLELAITVTARRHDLSAEVDDARARVVTATDRMQTARRLEQDARQRHQTLQQGRLDGMAAELAAHLLDGGPCVVCGSTVHPTPATTADPVSAEAVEKSGADWQARRETTHRESAGLAGLEQLLATRSADLDADLPLVDDTVRPTTVELAEQRRAAQARRDATGAEVARLAGAETRASTARATLTAAQGQLEAVAHTVASGQATLAEVSEQVAQRTAELSVVVQEHVAACPCGSATRAPAAPSVDLPAVASRHAHLVAAARDLAEALVASGEAAGEARAVEQSTLEALRDNGFDSVGDASAGVVASDVLSDLRRQLRILDDRKAAAEATLADEGVRAALDAAPVDPAQAAALADAARAELRRAQHAQTTAETSVRSLAPVRGSIADRVGALRPLADEHARIGELADTASGTGGQNTLRMRLTAFVLAARLEKVALLANERLRVMGDGRFQLAHSDDLAAGGRRSGLGLVVRDLWTGQVRDTASLSGGESFMASLALALGLADAVREEAGGFDLNTLFIDEGFGTLDDESLEQVMAVLDGLRDGGRCVGVVSHVSDLRSRVPVQIRVDKTSTGSRITVLGLDSPAA